MVAVGMDLEGVLVLEPFAQQYQFSFPVLVASPTIRDGTSPFGKIAALPTTVLLDREGTVIAGYEGVLDVKHLEELVVGSLDR